MKKEQLTSYEQFVLNRLKESTVPVTRQELLSIIHSKTHSAIVDLIDRGILKVKLDWTLSYE